MTAVRASRRARAHLRRDRRFSEHGNVRLATPEEFQRSRDAHAFTWVGGPHDRDVVIVEEGRPDWFGRPQHERWADILAHESEHIAIADTSDPVDFRANRKSVLLDNTRYSVDAGPASLIRGRKGSPSAAHHAETGRWVP